MTEPLRWTHPDADPPPEALALLQDLPPPPPLPPDVRARVRANVEALPTTQVAYWKKPAVLLLAVAAGVALVWWVARDGVELVAIEAVAENVTVEGAGTPGGGLWPDSDAGANADAETDASPATDAQAEAPLAPSSTETLPPPADDAQSVVEAHQTQVDACFDGTPIARGQTLQLSARIAPNGQPVRADVRGSFSGYGALLRCLEQAVMTWHFAPTLNGVTVHAELGSTPLEALLPSLSEDPVPPRDMGSWTETTIEAEARRLSGIGDNQGVIRLLEGGRARTPLTLALLIEAYRNQGMSDRAVPHMRRFTERYPEHGLSRPYLQLLRRTGGNQNTLEQQARRLSGMGDNQGVIRLLEGQAHTPLTLALLIEAYRVRGMSDRAVPHMRTFVRRYPEHRQARQYVQLLGRQSNPTNNSPASPNGDTRTRPARPPSGADQFGSISINTMPWSRVFIDGRDTGRNTPVRDRRMSAGEHTIGLRTNDGRMHRVQVTITAGQNTHIIRQL